MRRMFSACWAAAALAAMTAATEARPRVSLRCGDCVELMLSIPDATVDMVLCDPPYGVTNLAWDVRLPWDAVPQQYMRIAKPEAAIVLFAQQPYATELISAMRRWFRYEWIWDKVAVTGFLAARHRPLRAHENILVFYRSRALYQPQGMVRLPRPRLVRTATAIYGKNGGRQAFQEFTGLPRSILRFPAGRMGVPCEKPVALLEYLIRTYTRPGAVVLDHAMGSGSAGVAAVRTGRAFIGFEIDRKRFALAARRIREAQQEDRA